MLSKTPDLPRASPEAHGNRQWRERQQLEIQKRDEIAEAQKRETVEKAQTAIDDYYENYNTKRDKLVEETRWVPPSHT